MVPLPLFKLAALLVRHVSKYGANHIKAQAHEHPRFRQFAARYGQSIHQINMRLNVALLRNPSAEARAKEKAEAPTVKTKEEIEKEEEKKRKKEEQARIEAEQQQQQQQSQQGQQGTTGMFGVRQGHFRVFPATNLWGRKFRPLSENKAVDLFADVVGDAFILSVAMGLIVYEYWKASQKPDANLERIKDLDARFEQLQLREDKLEKDEEEVKAKVAVLEEALRALRDPKTKKPLCPTLQASVPSSA
ncbi:hypothetical protein BN1708_000541 [Verticillium longisporum]|uniref:OPA3-like protein n=2 Tax=Verticillium longisporum TaxID=100787 RepID=A0A0G4LDC9_VERLO|nr:hypothetical protein BN1708_000541 [Verticillium longisporum]